MSKKKMENIADLLPAGLTEDSIEQIATLVHDTINEQVDAKMKQLAAKVIGFMNVHMDMLKEAALRQLEDENDTFKKAALIVTGKQA